ncbi:hypothetical protein MKX01_011605 [Papaver californicum]|nr:hypothetical protein MKX01_011605 [Papaver californicum]
MVHGINHSLEMVETVMGVAKVAFEAVEFKHNHLDHHRDDHNKSEKDQQYHQALSIEEEKEIEALRYENHRLRNILEENLKLFQNISQSPSLTKDCPTDLYKRLEAAVESTKFLNQLESLHQASLNSSTNNFPFEETTCLFFVVVFCFEALQKLIWCCQFHGKMIISNPKTQKLTPQELQKTVAKALEGVNKVEQLVNIWHAGTMLYRHCGVLKMAAKGIGASGKLIKRAL